MSDYKVMIDDNFHYMNEGARVEFGTFATAAEAVAACRRIVDDWLERHYKPGMGSDQLFELFVMFGDDPYVISGAGPSDGLSTGERFSAWDYARDRARVLCRTAERS